MRIPGLIPVQEENQNPYHNPRPGAINIEDAVQNQFFRQVRDLDEISVDEERYRIDYVSDIGKLPLMPVHDWAQMKTVLGSLVAIDMVDEMLWGLGEDAYVDEEDCKALEVCRRKLMQILMASDDNFLKKLREFSWKDKEYSIRFENVVFDALLKVMRMQYLNQSMYLRYVNLTFTSSKCCSQLFGDDIVPEVVRTQRVMEMLVADLRSCIIQLEIRSRQVKLVYDSRESTSSDNLLTYIDVLLMTAAQLTQQTQPPQVFTGSGDYGTQTGNMQMRATDVFLEDLLWTLIPLAKSLYQQKKLFSKTGAKLPLTKQHAAQLSQFLCAYSKDKSLFHPREELRKLYPKLVIRPSEPRRYARKAKAAVMHDWGIIQESRGNTEKGRLVSNLSHPPWVFVAQKKDTATLRDAMLLLVLNAYVNNRSSLTFFSTFVVFRQTFSRQPNPEEFLRNKKRPLIVESFNHYNFYHNGVLYVYNSAMLSFMHWIRVLLSPPYNGFYGSVDIRGVVKGLPNLNLLRGGD